jgi:hypothetical protein
MARGPPANRSGWRARQLLADGRVESIHVGRLRRIPADALGSYIDRQRGAGADLQA